MLVCGCTSGLRHHWLRMLEFLFATSSAVVTTVIATPVRHMVQGTFQVIGGALMLLLLHG